MRPLDLLNIKPVLKDTKLNSITPYGNAPNGDYPAIFTGAFEAKYPKSPRLIFGFTILNADGETPHNGSDGGGLYAVAICNKSDGTNPKSKPFKIRRAMLQPEEFKDLKLATSPPPPEHFTEPYDDRNRILEIRVERRQTDGKQVSIVTHIRRPRDGEWQCIEGEYEGPATGMRNIRPFWLNDDQRTLSFHDPAAERVPPEERDEFHFWNQTTPDQLERWRNPDGTLQALTEEELRALHQAEFEPGLARYRIAQRRAALGWPPFG